MYNEEDIYIFNIAILIKLYIINNLYVIFRALQGLYLTNTHVCPKMQIFLWPIFKKKKKRKKK